MPKAIFLDSLKMKLKSVEITDFESIQRLISSNRIEAIPLANNLLLYVDGVAKLRVDPYEFGFYLNSAHYDAFWGNGLVVQLDEDGEHSDIEIPTKDIKAMIKYWIAPPEN